MATALKEKQKQVMPGSFEPEGYDEDSSNPLETLTQVQEEWRNRERPDAWSTSHLTNLDLTGIDWHRYGPPGSASSAPGITTQVILDIVTKSIENVREKANEETRRHREVEEQRTAAEREAAVKPKEIEYLPIIIPPPPAPAGLGSPTSDGAMSPRDSTRDSGSVGSPDLAKSPDSFRRGSEALSSTASAKQRKGRFRKFLDKVGEMGESSSSPGGRLGLLPPAQRPADYVAPNALPPPNVADDGPPSPHFATSAQELAASSENPQSIRIHELGTSAIMDLGASLRANIRILQTKSTELPGSTPAQARSSGVTRAASILVSQPLPLEPVECVSCLDEFPPSNMVKVPCHSYCHDCFAGLISAACQNEQQWPPKCCLNEIPFRTILRYIPADLRQRFKDRSSEWKVPVNERIYCSQPECSLWINPDNIRRSANKARCERGHWTCTICRGPQHSSGDCPQDRDMNLTNQLAEEEGWKRCYNCSALVEHKEACQHMTCRCGSQFCYVCGLRWRTCSCTMEQLHSVKEAAAARQQERRAKEAAESEELRQILSEIAEFERQETLKAEMERQENIRLEEIRQQQELLEHVRLECIRRLEVEAKFLELRLTLDRLHDAQVAMLGDEQLTVERTLLEENNANKEKLVTKHQEDREQLEASIEERKTEKLDGFSSDYNIRAAFEKKLLDEYEDQLKRYWRNRRNGPLEIEKAMATVRKTMEQYYEAWKEWRGREEALYLEMLEEERTIMNELVTSRAQRMKEQQEESVVDLGRRRIAERKWLQLIAIEREKLLYEAEEQEMEGEADAMFASEKMSKTETAGGDSSLAGPAPKPDETEKTRYRTVNLRMSEASPSTSRTPMVMESIGRAF